MMNQNPIHTLTLHRTSRRQGVALLASVLLIVLLIATAAELATVTGTAAVVSQRRNQTLAHELAVDSALLLLAEELLPSHGKPSQLIRDLDRDRVSVVRFHVGDVVVRCTIRDDGAKFNPRLFQQPQQQSKLTRKLNLLASTSALPRTTIRLRPIITNEPNLDRYLWFDQIIDDAAPGSFFPLDRHSTSSDDGLLSQPLSTATHRDPVWSDLLTFWGDGRVALRRTSEEVLEAALGDIQPGLGRAMLARRPNDLAMDFTQTAMTAVPAELQQQVASRVTFDAQRYALCIDSRLEGDHRVWYIVARIDQGQVDVLHRSQRTW